MASSTPSDAAPVPPAFSIITPETGQNRVFEIASNPGFFIPALGGLAYLAGYVYYLMFFEQLGLPGPLIRATTAEYVLLGLSKVILVGLGALVVGALIVVAIFAVTWGATWLALRAVGLKPEQTYRDLPMRALVFAFGPVGLVAAAIELTFQNVEIRGHATLVQQLYAVALVATLAAIWLIVRRAHGADLARLVAARRAGGPLSIETERADDPRTWVAGVLNLTREGVTVLASLVVLIGIASAILAAAVVPGVSDAVDILSGDTDDWPAAVITMVDRNHDLHNETAYLVMMSNGVFHVVVPDCVNHERALIMTVQAEQVVSLDYSEGLIPCPFDDGD